MLLREGVCLVCVGEGGSGGSQGGDKAYQGSTLSIAHWPGTSKKGGGASKPWEPLARWGK